MERSKLLTIIAVGLLVGNLLLTGFIIMHGQDAGGGARPPRRPEPRDIIIERLHFDEGQVKQYEQLIRWHRQHIRQQEERMRDLKNELYTSLTAPENPERRDSLITQIGDTQQEMEKVHYKHFTDLRALCKPDQMKAFDELTHEIAALFGPRPPGPRPGRGRRP